MRGPYASNILLLLTAIIPVALSSQSVFKYLLDSELHSPKKTYKPGWPVKRVAVIGAGVGGITAYRELKKDGFDVHIFERDYLPGGTWHYTDQIPLDASIPNAPIEIADFQPSLPPPDAEFPYVEEYHNQTWCAYQRRSHRAPKPIWEGLTTNGPAPTQEVQPMRELSGVRRLHLSYLISKPTEPPNISTVTSQAKVGRYLRAFASWNGVNTNDDSSDISYNTRVELVEKRLDLAGKQIGWTLITKELEKIEGGRNRATWDKQEFDAIVVASGRYNAPNIPRIEGLEAWGKQFPDSILHSRQYRHPENYAGKTVLIVGAAASGTQISREMSAQAAKIYQSVRVGGSSTGYTSVPNLNDALAWACCSLDPPAPFNVSVVTEIKRFHPPSTTIQTSAIELVDGTILYGIDHVLFATGYHYTYPFLPEYHNPTLGRTGEAPEDTLIKPIVTDGSHLRSLHLDTFYIDNPTLAFVNANMGTFTFAYSEFQSFAMSMVWAGKARLPMQEEMWGLYRKRVEEIGYGKLFSFLGKREDDMITYFRGWLNAAAAQYGGRQIDGLPFELSQVLPLWIRAWFGDPRLVRNVTIPGTEHAFADFLANGDEAEMDYDLHNDYW
ncbi:hypothetical protein D9756_010050 [Leucocoprinus leucothites]|uniref:FAD/NAD(P)-binding domain-containing protein n=1 Tax=Leucocoprinus leucothites TaxID=201217 RepID=A0A8H5CSE2_9AGAR|nr:hypothetical protein D9756_010050 [Leucoagaricus leucothites]